MPQFRHCFYLFYHSLLPLCFLVFILTKDYNYYRWRQSNTIYSTITKSITASRCFKFLENPNFLPSCCIRELKVRFLPLSWNFMNSICVTLNLEKAMVPHSSTLAWKIPWKEPGRLLRLEHNWATSLSFFTFMHWRRKWQPTPVFLPGESQGWGSLMGTTEAT